VTTFRLIHDDEARTVPATAADLADAADLGPNQGARRLYRRRILRGVAAEVLGVHPDLIVIDRLAHGGVAIVGPKPLYASLSGRGAWTALGISERPVGVDVELYPPERDPPFDVLAPLEQETILTDPEPRHLFLRFWTAREAYLKAQGRGIDVEPSAIRAARRDQEVALIEAGHPIAFATVIERDDAIAAIVELEPEA
jgi:4'-phosphopantetheinyl transferase